MTAAETKGGGINYVKYLDKNTEKCFYQILNNQELKALHIDPHTADVTMFKSFEEWVKDKHNSPLDNAFHDTYKINGEIQELCSGSERRIEEAIKISADIKDIKTKTFVFASIGGRLAQLKDIRADIFFKDAFKYAKEYKPKPEEKSANEHIMSGANARMLDYVVIRLCDAGRFNDAKEKVRSIECKEMREHLLEHIGYIENKKKKEDKMAGFDKNIGSVHEAIKLNSNIEEMIKKGMVEEAVTEAENIKNKSAKPFVYATLGAALAKQNDGRADTFFDKAIKHISEYEYDILGDTLGKDFPRMHLARNLADANRFIRAMQVAGSIEEKGIREKMILDIKKKKEEKSSTEISV